MAIKSRIFLHIINIRHFSAKSTVTEIILDSFFSNFNSQKFTFNKDASAKRLLLKLLHVQKIMQLRDQLLKLKLGLNRKIVTLIPHQSDWSVAFDITKRHFIELKLNDLELHHIGSTSIPGIQAKPILDILGVVSSIEKFDKLKNQIEALGFVWKGEYGIANRRYCVLYDDAEELGLIHLHVFAQSNPEIEKHLIFRDYLRSDPEAAKRYEDIKKGLEHTEVRSNYSQGKSDFIEKLLHEAYSWKKNTLDLKVVRKIHSLAYKTDFSILAFQGRLKNCDEYIVAESPGNPDYFWGNLLLMKNPPKPGDYEKWSAIFKKEFSHQPLIKHITFGWDSVEGTEGATDEFTNNGFEIERSVVLTLKENGLINAKYSVSNLEIRILKSDKDWEDATQNQVECKLETFKLDVYLPFKRVQMKKYKEMSKAGLVNWFGAFLNGRLVADCGVYCFNGVGRYQAVGTHPDYRKKGICGNLIHESAKFAFEKLGVNKLVMVADPEYHAAKVYESIGFKPTEKSIGMYRYPKDDWNS